MVVSKYRREVGSWQWDGRRAEGATFRGTFGVHDLRFSFGPASCSYRSYVHLVIAVVVGSVEMSKSAVTSSLGRELRRSSVWKTVWKGVENSATFPRR